MFQIRTDDPAMSPATSSAVSEAIGLPAIRALPQAMVPFRPDRTLAGECDGAATLRLVEEAMETMQALRLRADTISAQSLELIELTRRERVQVLAELDRVRWEAAEWRRQAAESDLRVREAVLRAREAEIARREAELEALAARGRASAAEAEVESLRLYLRKIGTYLRARLTA